MSIDHYTLTELHICICIFVLVMFSIVNGTVCGTSSLLRLIVLNFCYNYQWRYCYVSTHQVSMVAMTTLYIPSKHEWLTVTIFLTHTQSWNLSFILLHFVKLSPIFYIFEFQHCKHLGGLSSQQRWNTQTNFIFHYGGINVVTITLKEWYIITVRW